MAKPRVEAVVSILCFSIEEDTDCYLFPDIYLDDCYEEILVASIDICDEGEVREISATKNYELLEARSTDAYCGELRDSLERG